MYSSNRISLTSNNKTNHESVYQSQYSKNESFLSRRKSSSTFIESNNFQRMASNTNSNRSRNKASNHKTDGYRIANVLPLKFVNKNSSVLIAKSDSQHFLTPDGVSDLEASPAIRPVLYGNNTFETRKEKLKRLFREGRKYDTIKYHFEENKDMDSPWKFITEYILSCDPRNIKEKTPDPKFPFLYIESKTRNKSRDKLSNKSRMKSFIMDPQKIPISDDKSETSIMKSCKLDIHNGNNVIVEEQEDRCEDSFKLKVNNLDDMEPDSDSSLITEKISIHQK